MSHALEVEKFLERTLRGPCYIAVPLRVGVWIGMSVVVRLEVGVRISLNRVGQHIIRRQNRGGGGNIKTPIINTQIQQDSMYRSAKICFRQNIGQDAGAKGPWETHNQWLEETERTTTRAFAPRRLNLNRSPGIVSAKMGLYYFAPTHPPTNPSSSALRKYEGSQGQRGADGFRAAGADH